MIKIRDSKGKIYNKVNNPAIIVDTVDPENYFIRKIGEKEILEEKYKELIKKYKKAGLKEEVKKTILVELPKDQELVDKISNYNSFLKKVVDVLKQKE